MKRPAWSRTSLRTAAELSPNKEKPHESQSRLRRFSCLVAALGFASKVRSRLLLSATLGPAGAETIAAQDGPARLRFEGDRIGLAALIANDFKSLPLCSAAASLSATSKACAARVAAGFASLGMAQPPLAIIILFSFSKWE